MSGANKAAAGIGISRGFGLVREALIGATLGATPAADAFRTAMKVPNIVQNLLGEGSLSASFVPVYARLIEERNEVEARRVAGGVLGLLTAAIMAIVALMVIAADPVISITAPGLQPEVHDQAVWLTRITAPGIGLLGISAWCLGILNAHRQYFLSYVAPALWNLAQITMLTGVVLTTALLSSDPTPERITTLLAIAVGIGSMLQLGVQVPRVRALTHGVTPHLNRSGQVGVVLKRFAPALGARGVVQLSSYIDLTLASFLATSSIASLALVMPLYLLPISLFGFAIATAELTEMSRQSDRAVTVAHRLEVGLRKIVLPAGLVLAVFTAAARPVITTMYQWLSQVVGKSPISDGRVDVMALVLFVFALALPATMSARVTQNALYALGDVRRPAQIAVIRLVVLVVVTILVMFQFDRLIISGGSISGWSDLPAGLWDPLPTSIRGDTSVARLGAVGIAFGAAIASVVEWLLLRRALEKRVGRHVSSGLAFPVAAASLGTAVSLWLIQVILPIGAPIEGIVIGIAAVAIYIGLLRFQGLRPRDTAT